MTNDLSGHEPDNYIWKRERAERITCNILSCYIALLAVAAIGIIIYLNAVN